MLVLGELPLVVLATVSLLLFPALLWCCHSHNKAGHYWYVVCDVNAAAAAAAAAAAPAASAAVEVTVAIATVTGQMV